ncbi:MAG: T9SS type A sorting domain-containing protein [Bacteroidia bacterium]
MKLQFKNIFSCVFLLLLSVQSNGQGTGYVIIEGKQFYNGNGQPFYPTIVNWGAGIIYDPVAMTYHLSTHHSNGANNDFECSGNLPDCDTQILNEFNYIRSMGFNSIRVNSLNPIYDAVTGKLCFIATDPYTTPTNWINTNVPMQDPSFTDLNSQTFFGMYQKILTIASQVTVQPFYVIIQTGFSNKVGNITYDWGAVIQPLYTQFLTEMGNQLQSYPNFMAYDFYNEPCFALYGDHSKEEVCAFSEGWYVAVTTHDTHHLATIGNCWDDVMEFDPAVLKVDFLSPHFYPATRVFQYEYPPGTFNATQSTTADYEARVEGTLYWLNNNLPMPWIIGENGFSASSGKSYADGLDGTLSEQQSYADFSLNRVRDCNGSGYSWWNYQDNFDHLAGTPGYGGDFYGLLEKDIATCPYIQPCSTMNKPVDSFFSGYLYPTPVPSNCTQPANYFDPLNHAANSTTQQFTVTGHVQDQYGNPIKDAVVASWCYTYDKIVDIITGATEPQFYYHTTFTDASGDFTIIPYDYVPLVAPNDGWFEAIRISAPSSQVYCANWCSTPNAVCPPNIDLEQQNVYLNADINRNYFGYDETVNNVTVPLNTPAPVNFKGWNTLTVNSLAGSNVIVEGNGTTGATSDFTARKEIHINSEFHAQHGSEVHIYPSTVFPECIDYTGYRASSQNVISSVNEPSGEKWIELAFKQKDELIEVEIVPNPNNGYCTLKIKGTDSFNGELSITDVTGRHVLNKDIHSIIEHLNLSDLSKGIYYFEIKNNSETINKKIILN